MKILFLDQGSDLQQKWIEPLRKKGWGVVRARSAEDATRMMSLHGDALEAVVIGERFVEWAEKQGLPFVVLTTTWNDAAVLKHQNSDHSAVSYLSYASGTEELYSLFEASQAHALKATGTEGVPLSLQDYSQVLAKPEAKAASPGALHLEAPTIVLGGQDAKSEVQAVSFDQEADEDVTAPHDLKLHAEMVPQPEPTSIENRTVLLDSTSVEMENSLNELPEVSMGELDSLDDLDLDLPQAQEAPRQFTPPPPPVAPIYSTPVNQFSVNPNPSAQISDLETLRSYLALREQDVAVLSGQVRSSQERIQQLEMLLKMEKARGTELSHMVSRQEQQIKNYDQEKQVEHEVLERQIEDVNNQLKERTDKARTIEAKLRITVDEVNKVKERVRVDIRRIRVREKELEGQLEVLRKDSTALLQARDEKILELKRKLDLLEFNMELVQEQFGKEKQTADELKTRLKDAAALTKQAGGLLEQ